MGLDIRPSEMKLWNTFTLERQLEVMVNADSILASRGEPNGTITVSDAVAAELIGI